MRPREWGLRTPNATQNTEYCATKNGTNFALSGISTMAAQPDNSDLTDADTTADGCAEPILEMIGVTKRHWDNFLALDAVSLSLRRAEVYCLLGAAAAGKTLLLQTCVGFAKPTVGRVLVAGRSVVDAPTVAKRHITYVPRGAPMYGSLTARQNVEFFVRADGTRPRCHRPDYYNAMRKVGIAERDLERQASKLSPTILTSLWLAITLLRDTPLLLLDEPTVGLDPYASATLQDRLREFREQQKAVLVATSDVLLASGIADRVGILTEGRKRIELSRAELVGRSLPELYLEYMGRPLARTIRTIEHFR